MSDSWSYAQQAEDEMWDGVMASDTGPRGPVTVPDLYWWHGKVRAELERLAALGEASYPAKGIAGNVGFSHADTRRYLAELAACGQARVTEPAWDFADEWYGAAEVGA